MGGFFGGGASVDLASPSAIGSTTPNTGAFTTLSANSTVSFSAAGTRAAPTIQIRNANSGIYSPANGWIGFALGGTSSVQIANNFLILTAGSAIAWSSEANDPSQIGSDLSLFRDGAADILAQRRTTNAQTFRLYRTFTDASNYERLSLIATRTTRFAIAAENAGTGAARSLEISFYTSASDPTSTDITSGCFSVWKNSGTGTIKLWTNDGGTMKSVALA